MQKSNLVEYSSTPFFKFYFLIKNNIYKSERIKSSKRKTTNSFANSFYIVKLNRIKEM